MREIQMKCLTSSVHSYRKQKENVNIAQCFIANYLLHSVRKINVNVVYPVVKIVLLSGIKNRLITHSQRNKTYTCKKSKM